VKGSLHIQKRENILKARISRKKIENRVVDEVGRRRETWGKNLSLGERGELLGYDTWRIE